MSNETRKRLMLLLTVLTMVFVGVFSFGQGLRIGADGLGYPHCQVQRIDLESPRLMLITAGVTMPTSGGYVAVMSCGGNEVRLKLR